MGLLTDPNSRQRAYLGVLLTSHYQALSWLAFLLGLVFLLVLPHPLYNEKTYFSENALLPGLVTNHFSEEAAARSFLTSLKEESSNLSPWLMAQLRGLGLEVHEHTFSLNYPLSNRTFSGTNIYAILRAPKAASTEALVLSAPLRPPSSPHQDTHAGIAILLAAAKHFRSQIYWAKDIIFLLTEHEFLGMQAWLEAYHGVTAGEEGVLEAGELPARAGSIQAAINLELATPSPTHLNVKVLGMNGQLPNLDLVNLVNRLCLREGLRQMMMGAEDHPRPSSWTGYLRSLKTLASMMVSQVTGVPDGNHGLFHRFGIEAVTLEGVTHKSKRRAQGDFFILGRIVEGTFRSLNNLLERFHQSFFFYVLSAGGRYISIGMYMPMFGLLAGGFLLTAVGTWFKLIQAAKEAATGADKEVSVCVPPVTIPPQLSSVLPIWVASHCLGFLASQLPYKLAAMGYLLSIPPEESIPLGLTGFSLLLAAIPFLPKPQLQVSHESRVMVQCLVCLELAALAGCVSLSNFSLATLCTLVYLPLSLLCVPPSLPLAKPLVAAFTLLCHPLSLALVCVTVDTAITFPSSSLSQLATRSLSAWQSGLVFSVVDRAIYNNVLYDMASIFLVPVWILLYLTVMAPKQEEKPKED